MKILFIIACVVVLAALYIGCKMVQVLNNAQQNEDNIWVE